MIILVWIFSSIQGYICADTSLDIGEKFWKETFFISFYM